MKSEFLLRPAIRHEIKQLWENHRKEYARICAMDKVLRLAERVKSKYPDIVRGPYGSAAIALDYGLTLRCVVMRLEDAAPVLEYLLMNGCEVSSSSDEVGYRRHLLWYRGLLMYVDCYPDEENGSECQRVPTGKYTGAHPIYEYVCGPDAGD